MRARNSKKIKTRNAFFTLGFLVFALDASAAKTCKVDDFCGRIAKDDPEFVVYRSPEGFFVRDFAKMRSAPSDREPIRSLERNPLLNGIVTDPDYVRAELRGRALFEETKRLLSLAIQRSTVLSRDHKAEILKRIETVGVRTQASKLGDGIGMNPVYMEWYHQVAHVSAGNELPDAALIEIFAHEIGHSFDFGNLRMVLKRSGDGWYLAQPDTIKDSSAGLKDYFKIERCLLAVGVKENQISEAFADLVAAAVLRQRVEELAGDERSRFAWEGIAYPVSQACLASSDTDVVHYSSGDLIDNHPKKRLRIESLFLGEKSTAEALGCDPNPGSCSI